MQHIPDSNLQAIEDGNQAMQQFNEDFKALFGCYPREYCVNQVEETTEERQTRIASYNLTDPTFH